MLQILIGIWISMIQKNIRIPLFCGKPNYLQLKTQLDTNENFYNSSRL